MSTPPSAWSVRYSTPSDAEHPGRPVDGGGDVEELQVEEHLVAEVAQRADRIGAGRAVELEADLHHAEPRPERSSQSVGLDQVVEIDGEREPAPDVVGDCSVGEGRSSGLRHGLLRSARGPDATPCRRHHVLRPSSTSEVDRGSANDAVPTSTADAPAIIISTASVTGRDPAHPDDRQVRERGVHVVDGPHRNGTDRGPRDPAPTGAEHRSARLGIDHHPEQGVDQGDGLCATGGRRGRRPRRPGRCSPTASPTGAGRTPRSPPRPRGWLRDRGRRGASRHRGSGTTG